MFSTNAYISYSAGFVGVYPSTYNNGTCDCSNKFTCTQQIVLKMNTTYIPVPGWYIGCYMIDSLLDSTLECYYNQTCIQLIYNSFSTVNLYGVQWNTSTPQPQSLNVSQSLIGRFPMNSTIRDCLQELLVETWNPTTDFNSYYEQCQPTGCSYTLNIRKDLLVVVTTLVGLLGGLSAALNVLAPIAVRIIYDFIPEYFGYFQQKVGLSQRMSINRVAVIDH